jgi:hypothetical protein
MSPIDNHLRDTLNEHATEVADGGDLFAAVEQRARTMHRRRVAWASGATAVVLAGGVLGGVTLFGTDQDTVKAPIGNDGNGTPTPSATPTPSESAPPGPVAERSFLQWPYREGDGVAAAELAYLDEHSLWGGAVGDAIVVIGQQADGAGNVRARAWVSTHGETYQLEGAVLKPAVTSEVSFVLPGDAYPFVLVIGAPTTGQIQYAEDAETFRDVPEMRDGWALFKRTSDGNDRIRVLDGDGDLDHPAYEGPIDTGPSEPDV